MEQYRILPIFLRAARLPRPSPMPLLQFDRRASAFPPALRPIDVQFCCDPGVASVDLVRLVLNRHVRALTAALQFATSAAEYASLADALLAVAMAAVPPARLRQQSHRGIRRDPKLRCVPSRLRYAEDAKGFLRLSLPESFTSLTLMRFVHCEAHRDYLVYHIVCQSTSRVKDCPRSTGI